MIGLAFLTSCNALFSPLGVDKKLTLEDVIPNRRSGSLSGNLYFLEGSDKGGLDISMT